MAIIEGQNSKVAPPALPLGAPNYSQDLFNQTNNILRLFFNRLGNLVNLHTETINSFLRPTINYQSGTTYTITADDEVAVIICTNASPVTVYVPQDSTLDLPIGYITHVYQGNTGQVTITPEAASPTINYPTSASTRTQYSPLSLIKVAADTWHIFGDAG